MNALRAGSRSARRWVLLVLACHLVTAVGAVAGWVPSGVDALAPALVRAAAGHSANAIPAEPRRGVDETRPAGDNSRVTVLRPREAGPTGAGGPRQADPVAEAPELLMAPTAALWGEAVTDQRLIDTGARTDVDARGPPGDEAIPPVTPATVTAR